MEGVCGAGDRCGIYFTGCYGSIDRSIGIVVPGLRMDGWCCAGRKEGRRKRERSRRTWGKGEGGWFHGGFQTVVSLTKGNVVERRSSKVFVDNTMPIVLLPHGRQRQCLSYPRTSIVLFVNRLDEHIDAET